MLTELPFNTIVGSDALSTLKVLPPNSVDLCITSPPYLGLRDYETDGQLGSESDVFEYVEHLIEVFTEVHRVLKTTGSFYLNIADSYAGSGRGRMGNGTHHSSPTAKQGSNLGSVAGKLQKIKLRDGVKQKDLWLLPHAIAWRMRETGWWVRESIIWRKPGPMTESVKDRCTRSYEFLFHFTKSRRYYYDWKAIAEPTKDGALKNKRDIWTIPQTSFKGAHCAVFPEKLVEPPILAACPPGGVVLDPFMGSGTVGVVAKRHGRKYLGIESNPKYVFLAAERIKETK